MVEADPGVLARTDIELAVRARLMDTSTSVREAAVDLLGRFLICRPELTAQYYPMLSDRIRDKGVSVRKRVIRILRDICVEQPDFPRIAEICVMIIRRINDEESVKVCLCCIASTCKAVVAANGQIFGFLFVVETGE